jgi:hypothetical protein
MNQLPKSKIEGYELVSEINSCKGCCFVNQDRCPLDKGNDDCFHYQLIYQPTKPTNDEMQRPELSVSE